MPNCVIKYIVKYANGHYLGKGRKSRMVKSKSAATRFETMEEARGRARARAVINHTKEHLQHYTIEIYKERGRRLKKAKREIPEEGSNSKSIKAWQD